MTNESSGLPRKMYAVVISQKANMYTTLNKFTVFNKLGLIVISRKSRLYFIAINPTYSYRGK